MSTRRTSTVSLERPCNEAAVDAFVALGGQPDKSGSIRAEVLVEIIKSDFELTIDMEVSEAERRARA